MFETVHWKFLATCFPAVKSVPPRMSDTEVQPDVITFSAVISSCETWWCLFWGGFLVGHVGLSIFHGCHGF